MIARVMSDRQPIALVGHDGLELGAGKVTCRSTCRQAWRFSRRCKSAAGRIGRNRESRQGCPPRGGI